MIKDEIKTFVQERNEALFSLDREKIRAFIKKHHPDSKPMDDERVFWIFVHKAVTGIVSSEAVPVSSAERKLQLQSARWLLQQGMEHYLTDMTVEEFQGLIDESFPWIKSEPDPEVE